MTFIKICGLTNLDDATCALNAGADMLGFIFFPKSPRYVQPAPVREILDGLGSRRDQVKTVGVFVNESPQSIVDILDQTGLDMAQLSGDEPVSDVIALAGRAYKVVRSIAQAHLYMPDILSVNQKARHPDLLLDADHPTLYGGSGARADESTASTLARKCRLLLAGGLRPENVTDAITHARPWGVDVASGVEASPGRKDHEKIARFISAVRQADINTA
jgi:phosphoribosylanthranilate isomerase